MYTKVVKHAMIYVPQPFLLSVFLVLVAAVLLLKKRSPGKATLPPGPWRLPVIGSLHHLAVGANRKLPQRRLWDLANKYGPLMHLQLGQVSAIVVSSPEVASQVMKTHDLAFASRAEFMAARIFTYGFRDVVIAPYGDYWRVMKKMCVVELLSARRVRSYRYIREEEASRLLESISGAAPGSPVNLSSMFVALANAISWRATFGSSEYKDQRKVLECLHEMVRLTSGVTLVDFYPSVQKLLAWLTGTRQAVQKVFQEMNGLLDQIIEERRLRSATRESGNAGKSGVAGKDVEQEDLLDLLLSHYALQDLGFPLSINDIKAVVQDMFLAATDTTATAIEWAMSEMVKNPKTMAKAQSEVRRVFEDQRKLDESNTDQLHYLKLVIKEALRLHPPIPIAIPRECREAAVVAGYEIQPKTRVLVNAWALGRNPKQWVDPEEFRPERFLDPVLSCIDYKGTNFNYIPFGAGRRNCPGTNFGLAIVEIVLAQLLCHFDWRLTGDAKTTGLDMEETFGVTAGRKNPLCLVAELRIPYTC